VRHIGSIQHVQIQRASLKTGEKPHRVYDPAPLLAVHRLWLAREGVFGQKEDVAWIVDVHHALHPQSRNSIFNGVSFNFTSHYAEMRARFGDFLCDGCAGENILIACDRNVTLDDLGKRLAIESDGQLIYLDDLRIAAPCVEFSHYVNRAATPLPAETIKATLQFLDAGQRGFYAIVNTPGSIAAGDAVFVVD
jgi:hypothetical protein